MKNRVLKSLTLLAFIGNLLVILIIWLGGSALGFKDHTLAGPLIALGDLAGLLAFYLILWQLMLITRVGWIEKAWGHDRLSHAHHVVGIVAVLVLLIHPPLLILGYSSQAHTTLVAQFFEFIKNYEDVFKAFIAYLLFVVIVLLSLQLIRKKLKYENWYFIHIFLYVAIIISFGHQAANGHDFYKNWIIWYWDILFFAVFLNVLYFRFLSPLLLMRRHAFYVKEIHEENDNVTSIIISGKNLEKLKARAGQFVIVRFLKEGFYFQAHPFSLSEKPNGERLRLTIKAIGDFTSKIREIPVGTKILIEGPLGRFTSDRADRSKVLMIAGGIGITPLRSMFEELSGQGREVDLIFAVRSEKDLVLRSELDRFSNSKTRATYLPEDKFGRLAPELILKSAPDVVDRDVFVCGPPAMMRSVIKQLIGLGLSKKHIFYERFQLG